MREDQQPQTGRCACGGVRYRVDGDLRPVILCHCDRCRRITGHVMAASGSHDDDLELTHDDTLRWYEPSPGVYYGFCGTCGSTLFWRADDHPGWTSIAAGTLDPPTGLSTAAAWWTATASDYHDHTTDFTTHPHEPDAQPREVDG